jgi:hypothetical protein
MTAPDHLATKRMVCALAMLSVLAIAGCGEPAPDPTVTRTDNQADMLRERLRTGQGAS